MFLIGNLGMHSLEWVYPEDSSSFSADLQWIGFVLKNALRKRLYLVFKARKTL